MPTTRFRRPRPPLRLSAAGLPACRARRRARSSSRSSSIREDFFLGGVFRNLDDRMSSSVIERSTRASACTAAAGSSTRLSPASTKPFPAAPYRAGLRLERRASHEGMVDRGNPLQRADATRRRVLAARSRRPDPHLRRPRPRCEPRAFCGRTAAPSMRSSQASQLLPTQPARSRDPNSDTRRRPCCSSLARLLRRRLAGLGAVR